MGSVSSRESDICNKAMIWWHSTADSWVKPHHCVLVASQRNLAFQMWSLALLQWANWRFQSFPWMMVGHFFALSENGKTAAGGMSLLDITGGVAGFLLLLRADRLSWVGIWLDWWKLLLCRLLWEESSTWWSQTPVLCKLIGFQI